MILDTGRTNRLGQTKHSITDHCQRMRCPTGIGTTGYSHEKKLDANLIPFTILISKDKMEELYIISEYKKISRCMNSNHKENIDGV